MATRRVRRTLCAPSPISREQPSRCSAGSRAPRPNPDSLARTAETRRSPGLRRAREGIDVGRGARLPAERLEGCSRLIGDGAQSVGERGFVAMGK